MIRAMAKVPRVTGNDSARAWPVRLPANSSRISHIRRYLREDPRYYRRAHGSTGGRLFHAIKHSVVAYGEDGKPMFNFSEWLGTASAVVLANTYHPDNRRGFAPAARRFSYAIGSDIGFDVLREFWPEVARKFKLPFRDLSEPKN